MDRPIILIIDRDLDSRRIFRTALEWRGYTVVETGEPPEAVELARRHGPDLIIGDFPLPTEGTRPPVTEATLRGQVHHKRPQVLNVTARGLASDCASALDAADLVLLKPIEPLTILREVETRLNGGRTTH
jgi:two-component system phosphate regulon response regulator PhoB